MDCAGLERDPLVGGGHPDRFRVVMPVGGPHGGHHGGLKVLCPLGGYCGGWNDTGHMTQQMGGRCWAREGHGCVVGGPDDVDPKGPGGEDLGGPGDEGLKGPDGEDPSYVGGVAGTVVCWGVHKL